MKSRSTGHSTREKGILVLDGWSHGLGREGGEERGNMKKREILMGERKGKKRKGKERVRNIEGEMASSSEYEVRQWYLTASGPKISTLVYNSLVQNSRGWKGG